MTVSSSSSSKENAADHLQVSCQAACGYLEGRRSNTPNVDDDGVVLAALLEEEESEAPLLEKWWSSDRITRPEPPLGGVKSTAVTFKDIVRAAGALAFLRCRPLQYNGRYRSPRTRAC